MNPAGEMLPAGPLGWLVNTLMWAVYMAALQRVAGPWSRALGDRYGARITAWFRRKEERR